MAGNRKTKRCPKCRKDFEAGVVAAYKLGLIDGQRRSQKTINLLSTTNRHLYDEICRLDANYPLLDDPTHIHLILKIKRLESIIQELRRHGKHGSKNYNARILSEQLRDKRKNLARFFARVLS